MSDTISDSEIVEALMLFFSSTGKNPSREQIMRTLFDLMADANTNDKQ